MSPSRKRDSVKILDTWQMSVHESVFVPALRPAVGCLAIAETPKVGR